LLGPIPLSVYVEEEPQRQGQGQGELRFIHRKRADRGGKGGEKKSLSSCECYVHGIMDACGEGSVRFFFFC